MPELKQLHKDAIPAALEKASAIVCSTNPPKRRAFASTFLMSIRITSGPSSRFCSRSPIASKKAMASARRKRRNC